MSSATIKRSTENSVYSARVVAEIARFEAVRMVRHPVTWVGVALSTWLMWTLVWGVAPILDRDSVFLAGAMLPLAAATLLVADLSMLRQRNTQEMLGTTPTTTYQQVLGMQFGMFGPVFLALLLQGIGLIYLLVGGPIGSVDWLELAGGPAAVTVFGVGGVFLGRRLPHSAVALVTLVALAMLQFIASPDAQIFSPPEPTANVEWLAPWMTPSAFAPVENLTSRPSVLHLVYLIVLTGTLGIFALPMKGWARLVRLATAGAVTVAVVTFSLTLPSDPVPGFDWPYAAASQACDRVNGVEYCAFEFYADWIPYWQETIAAVHGLAPVEAKQVLQRPYNIGFEDLSVLTADGLIVASTQWDRDGTVPYFRLDLALRAAQSSVGLPTTPQLRPYTEEEIQSILDQNPDYPGDLRAQLEAEGEREAQCSAMGQARAAVSFWLAGSAVDDGLRGWKRILGERPWSSTFQFERVPFYGSLLGVADAELATHLLALSTADVLKELLARWDQVTDPDTTSAELASWFGLTALPVEDPGFHVEFCP